MCSTRGCSRASATPIASNPRRRRSRRYFHRDLSGGWGLTPKNTMRTHTNERGIALVLSLFLMTAMSVLGVSLMFLSQTETYASMNYRMMSQARYAGEAGIQKAANFLLDTAQYV